MSHNGVINASGDLLRSGFTDFNNSLESGQSQRTDVPLPSFTKLDSDQVQYHRWNGSWNLINKTTQELSLQRRTHIEIVISQASGVMQTQIDKIWNVNFSYSSQTAKTFKTHSSTFEKTTPFCFPGTNKANPTMTRIVGFTQQASTTMTARVFDVTNGNEIAQMTINDVDVTMAEDTALTDLPSGVAMFEVQIKSSNKQYVELESFEMR